MNLRESPLYWSLSCGNWFATQVRISVWFPLILLIFGIRLGWEVGLCFGAVFFVSVLFHEFGHVVGTRITGGSADEILIWPLGGLAKVQPASNLRSQLVSILAGPFVNLVLCLAALPAVVRSGALAEALNPFVFPSMDLAGNPVQALLLMIFTANWIQLLVNLLPVYPLDGGRVVHAILSHSRGRESATEWYLLIGFGAAALLLFGGLASDSTWLTAIGSVVLVLNMQEWAQFRVGETQEESFAGYDFSQGYTSLERAVETEPPARRVGWYARWKARRRIAREERALEQKLRLEQQVDLLLVKVREQGLDALTAAERGLLAEAGQRYREKGKPK